MSLTRQWVVLAAARSYVVFFFFFYLLFIIKPGVCGDICLVLF